jgi:hypothetical protein
MDTICHTYTSFLRTANVPHSRQLLYHVCRETQDLRMRKGQDYTLRALSATGWTVPSFFLQPSHHFVSPRHDFKTPTRPSILLPHKLSYFSHFLTQTQPFLSTSMAPPHEAQELRRRTEHSIRATSRDRRARAPSPAEMPDVDRTSPRGEGPARQQPDRKLRENPSPPAISKEMSRAAGLKRKEERSGITVRSLCLFRFWIHQP